MTTSPDNDPASSPHYAKTRELFDTAFYAIASGQPSRADFAYFSSESGVPSLYIWDPREETGHAVTPGDEPVLGAAALHPRKPWLAFAKDAGGNESYTVHMVDLAEQELSQITSEPLGRIGDLHWTRDEELIAVGNDTDSVYVRRIGLDGQIEELFSSKEQILSSDYDMASGTIIAAVGRGAGTRLAVIEPSGGVSRWISESETSEDRNPAVHPVARLLAYTSDGVADAQTLIVRSIDSLLEVARVDVPGEIGAMRWQSGHRLVAMITSEGSVTLRELDTRTREWSEPLSGVGAGGFALTSDGPIWSGSSFEQQPGIYTLVDGETIPLIGGGAGSFGVKAESHWFEAADGREIQGWLLRSSEPGAPLVVEAHGGPEWFTGDFYTPHILALVNAGYNVFSPNFRGSTSFGDEFRKLIVGDLGGAELEDVRQAAQYAGRLLGLDAKPAIFGGSYGGYLTLMALGTQPDDWVGGVAIVPPVDLVEDYELADAHFRQFHTYFMGGTPEELPDLYRERSPITHTAAIKGPVLVLHGENDPRCPLGPVQRMADEASQLGVPLQLHVTAEEGHGVKEAEAAATEMTLALDHLDRLFGRA
ncbi:MAG: S9 family peptidase [Anaerolineae bacterium]